MGLLADKPLGSEAARIAAAVDALVPALRAGNEATEANRWIGDALSRQLNDEAQFHQDRLGEDIDQWAATPTYMPYGLRVRARMDIGRALDLCRMAANLIFSLGGGSGIALSNPVQRHFRDIQACNSHPLQMATVQYEVYGRHLLGQPQITPFI